MSGTGRRAVWLYVVDVMMVVASLVMTVSWVLLWFVFPRGFYPAREAWLVVHKYSGLVLTLLVGVHGVLHWRWLVRMTGRVLRERQA